MDFLKKFFLGSKKVWQGISSSDTLSDGQELTRLQVPEKIYDDHKSVFFNLIYNTEKNWNEYDLKKTQFTSVMDDTLGNKFNMRKMGTFLQNEAIKGLYWGFEANKKSWNYFNSKSMEEIV